MNSLWNDTEAAEFAHDPLRMRVYTSRLLGRDPSLVLHGGGNTSVKASAKNLFGETEEILYIKGSGGDLATIEASGFAPVRLDALQKMAALPALSDSEMVRAQRAAMTDPFAPNPSVEAILHAIIPFRYVDHTHADAVVAITNTPDGEARIREIYGDRVLVIPYVMPGFVLARAVYERTRDMDWSRFEGMVLLHHGLFTFADSAQTSYESMISLVSEAEQYLEAQGALRIGTAAPETPLDLPALATLRRAVSRARGAAMIAQLTDDTEAQGFSQLPNLAAVATQGPLTPDHVIRTKRVPLLVGDDSERSVAQYANNYQEYFARHNPGALTMLDPAPRWAVWPGQGTLAFGQTAADTGIVSDIVRHTTRAIQWAEALGGWRALPEQDLFAMEYWELEQAKLKKNSTALPLQGRVALVTGAASGIGRAVAEMLRTQGACVAALDIAPDVIDLFRSKSAIGIVCDVTDTNGVKRSIESTISAFGGLDILVSNAGIFPPSLTIADMDTDVWRRSMDLNLTSHQTLLQACIPFLQLGWEPAVVFVGSKNVPAPGPGASAYSVAKAGLSQLARIAALELAEHGIRVNTVHPNAVFDTGIWTEEVLAKRAGHYGLSVDAYKTNNLLHVAVTSRDVAALVCALAGPLFSRTTGAQIPIDGGNDRVI